MKIVKKIKKTGNLTLFGQINDYPCFAPGALAEFFFLTDRFESVQKGHSFIPLFPYLNDFFSARSTHTNNAP